MPNTAKKTSARRAPAAKKKAPEKATSLVVQAYERIKERIITLHFLPGQYLNEAAICAQLGLGRTPVHQALQRLHIEGMIDVLPRKGIIVQPDSITEIIKILDSRLTVEPELARGAARRVAAGEIETDALDELKAIATATDPDQNPPDIPSFTINDRRFHREVADMSGNEVLADFARRLHERSTRFWYLNLWQTIDVPQSNRQHASIAEAIIAGSEEKAGERMHEHILSLRDRLAKVQQTAPAASRGHPTP